MPPKNALSGQLVTPPFDFLAKLDGQRPLKIFFITEEDPWTALLGPSFV